MVLAYLCVLIFGYEWEKQIEKSDKDLSEQTNLQVAFTIFDYAYTDKIPYEPKPSTLRWLFYSNIAIALAVLTIVS